MKLHRSRKELHKKIKSRTAIIVISVALLIVLGLVALNPTGKATQAGEFVDLDAVEFDSTSLAVTRWIFQVNSQQYDIAIASSDTGLVEYTIKQGTLLLSKGLLNSDVPSSGNIYLDNDNKSDIILELIDDNIIMTNQQFISPTKAVFSVTKDGKVVAGNILKGADGVFSYQFTISSSKPVTAEIDLDASWEISGQNSTATIYDLTYLTDEDAPVTLTVDAQVDEEHTLQTYTLASGDVLYAQVDENRPEVLLKEDGDNLIVTYTFRDTALLQPFSLPCGSIKTADLPETIQSIHTYKNGIQQWKRNTPSEFDELFAGRGYAAITSPTSFEITCTFTELFPPERVPILKTGWNLVGMGIPSLDQISQVESSEFTATEVLEFAIGGTLPATELQPGKAYWVKK